MMTILVRDYDEALDFFVNGCGFVCIEDTDMGNSKRWVRVRPRGSDSNDTGLLLARATTEAQRAAIGNQTGGRVMGFIETDDFSRDYHQMVSRGVKFLEAPRNETYGTVVVFVDCSGNRWDLIGPTRS